jgi:hypothetical protein
MMECERWKAEKYLSSGKEELEAVMSVEPHWGKTVAKKAPEQPAGTEEVIITSKSPTKPDAVRVASAIEGTEK